MKKENIFVSMSGGVDSSLAAAILKNRGYDVIGVTVKLWCYGTKAATDKSCCSLAAVQDAKDVASMLDIPHYVWDMEELFKTKVLEKFCLEYVHGRTPNPCVLCNSSLRFKFMLEKCLALGAHKMATGHYAQIKYLEKDKRFGLFKGNDPVKDQSYFLWGINSDKLGSVLFPLGNMIKTDSRKLAHELNLKTAKKKESQDLCFTGTDKYTETLKSIWGKPILPGEIKDKHGNLLGNHKGLIHYTIGQRRGLGIAADKPLYVTKIEPETNTLRVGPKDELLASSFNVSEINWLSLETFGKPTNCIVKIRSTHSGIKAEINWTDNNELEVILKTPEHSVTPGQSAVFYSDKDELLGGGIIQ
jgi:tRNA-uridine 2-sulfurtransferase